MDFALKRLPAGLLSTHGGPVVFDSSPLSIMSFKAGSSLVISLAYSNGVVPVFL